ncbi:MAG: peptidyl-prolyl cis-trans isomerase [Lentisphaeria bacterium]|nr:peptidyl-prolyl cis-trans isomerase [Candidatus Neomarinimicrobiota bacterium]MCF7841290.1 peptidyl-prolyl cis-trans isomerase [Lentisphaeria bacterium]
MRRSFWMRSLWVGLILISISACNRLNKDEVVAQVNREVLTMEKLRAMVPVLDQLDSLQRTHYVESWIQETLLKQEAEKHLLERDPQFKQQMDTYYRRLLADKMMQKFMRQSIQISDQEIRDYYARNQDNFRRAEDEIFALHVLLPSRDEARELRRVLLANDLDKKAEFLRKYQNETGLFKLSDLIPDLRNRLSRNREPGVYGPYWSDFGYHVMNVTQWYAKDDLRPLEEVWDEIAGRLSIDRQMDYRLAITDSLRAQANVSFHPALLNQSQSQSQSQSSP